MFQREEMESSTGILSILCTSPAHKKGATATRTPTKGNVKQSTPGLTQTTDQENLDRPELDLCVSLCQSLERTRRRKVQLLRWKFYFRKNTMAVVYFDQQMVLCTRLLVEISFFTISPLFCKVWLHFCADKREKCYTSIAPFFNLVASSGLYYSNLAF